MMRLLTTTILVMAAVYSAAITYSVPCLRDIVTTAGVKLPENLGESNVNDTLCSWNGKALRVCTDNHGIVCHVGYKLFPKEIISSGQYYRIFRFLERYSLELDLNVGKKPVSQRLSIDNITFTEGNPGMLKSINENSSINIDCIPRRFYKVVIGTAQGNVAITFPADCQLILGGNAIELESSLLERLNMQRSYTDDVLLSKWSDATSRNVSGMFLKDYGTYLSPSIGSTLYFRQHDGKTQLYNSSRNKQISVANILLSGISSSDIEMQLNLDRYGYQTDSITLTLRQFISFCHDDDAKVYIGIKKVNDTSLDGTLFIYNETLGYNHVVSFTAPYDIMYGKAGSIIRARMYAYIPLQNVTDKLFNTENYMKYDKYE